jgi:hypothetical protein
MDAFPPAETDVKVTEPVVEVDASSVNVLAIIVCAALKSPPAIEIVVAPEAVIAAKSSVPPNLLASRMNPFSVSIFVETAREPLPDPIETVTAPDALIVPNVTLPVDAFAPSIVTAPVVCVCEALKSPLVPMEITMAPDAVTFVISIAPPNVEASNVKLPVVTPDVIVIEPVPVPIEIVALPAASNPFSVTAPVVALAASSVNAPVVLTWSALKSPEEPIDTVAAPEADMLVISIAPPNSPASTVIFPPAVTLVTARAPVPAPIEIVAFPPAVTVVSVIAPDEAAAASTVNEPIVATTPALKSPLVPTETTKEPDEVTFVISIAPP